MPFYTVNDKSHTALSTAQGIFLILSLSVHKESLDWKHMLKQLYHMIFIVFLALELNH